jgi:hypothetical protein
MSADGNNTIFGLMVRGLSLWPNLPEGPAATPVYQRSLNEEEEEEERPAVINVRTINTS